jgi:2,4-dienoyl-CoA reductase (NADPH2)
MLTGKVRVGERVVIIGGGGIGHDVALFLARGEDTPPETIAGFKQHWGIGQVRTPRAPARSITMVKRSPGPFGKSLGKSTGWILRQELKDFGVRQIDDATYLSIEAGGLRISTGGTEELLPADTIVVCAGQLSLRELADQLIHANQNVHVIGGAANAGELDAKRAISEGALIGASL